MNNRQLTTLSTSEAALPGRVGLCRTLTRFIWGSTESHPTDKDEALQRYAHPSGSFAFGWIRGAPPIDSLQPIPASHAQSRPVTVIFDGKAKFSMANAEFMRQKGLRNDVVAPGAGLPGGGAAARASVRSNWGSTESHPTVKVIALHSLCLCLTPLAPGEIGAKKSRWLKVDQAGSGWIKAF